MFDKHFSKFYPLSFGTGGDKIQNALWRINNMSLPPSLQYIFIHSGASDIRHNDSEVISDGLINLKELTKYLRLTLLFMRNGEQREKFNFCFSRVFIQYQQNFHFGRDNGHQGIILSSLDTFLIFSNFLRTSVLGRLATCEATRKYRVYK